MVRDSRRDREHFDRCIVQYKNDSEFYLQAINRPDTKASMVNSLKHWIYSGYLKSVISHYSAGYDMSVVRREFKLALGYFQHLGEHISNIESEKLPLEQYNELLWTVSLAILLRVDSSEIEAVAKVVDFAERPDRLIDLLLASEIEGREISRDSYYIRFSSEMADRYKPLCEALISDSSEVKKSNLNEYLKLWYRRQQLCAWYGNAKNEKYFGYWSLESAAVAKLCNVTTSDLRKSAYLPTDLVPHA